MSRSLAHRLRLVGLAILLVASPAWAASRQLAKRSVAPTADVAVPRIVNGNLTSAYPSVGALVTPDDPDLSITLCTGTMIGCSTFLTAAHCVCSTNGAQCQPGPGAPHPSDFMVFLQHAGFFAVESIAVHPNFDFPTADVAVLKLADPVTAIRPTPINDVSSPPFGSDATIVGFGRSGGSSFDYSLKRAGQVETVDCGQPDLVCWNFESPLGPPGQDSNTCNADSGGPLLWDAGSGLTVAGITSGGENPNCLTDDFSFDTNVFQYTAYIESKGGADLDNTTCGSGPQVGDPEAPFTGITGSLSPSNTSDEHAFAVAPGLSELRVSMNASEAAADFDLYVKFGAPPTINDFDCRADGPSQLAYCGFDDPAAGTWYAMVRRISGSAQYQLTVTTIAAACTPEKEGLGCDDDNPCTTADTCLAGACVGINAAIGTPCDDGLACTPNDACSAGVCLGSTTPRTGCKSSQAGASTLSIREGTPVTQTPDSKDKMSWKWKKGSSTSLGEFGNPTTTDGFDVCLYRDVAGTSTVLLEAHLPAGPLWFPTPKGYRYRDRDRAQAGIDAIKLYTGAEGSARFLLSAKGEGFPVPHMPVPPGATLTLQLVGKNACFESTFSAFDKNQADLLKARSD